MLPTLEGYCEVNELIHMVTLYDKFSVIVNVLLPLNDFPLHLMAKNQSTKKKRKELSEVRPVK